MAPANVATRLPIDWSSTGLSTSTDSSIGQAEKRVLAEFAEFQASFPPLESRVEWKDVAIWDSRSREQWVADKIMAQVFELEGRVTPHRKRAVGDPSGSPQNAATIPNDVATVSRRVQPLLQFLLVVSGFNGLAAIFSAGAHWQNNDVVGVVLWTTLGFLAMSVSLATFSMMRRLRKRWRRARRETTHSTLAVRG